ncbi:MAG TPA: cell envelope biogenesis protein TolA [Sphingomonas sp.]|nr:cell envelope biogenesis protein TolA [Sphingomonas sp.]
MSLVDKVGLEATAPQSVTPPAQSKAPELGNPEDAPAAPADESEPDPTPPAPQPKAAPPPKPAPAPPKPPEKRAVKKPDAAKAPPTREATMAAKPNRAEAQAAGAGTRSGKRPRGGDLGAVMAGISAQPSRSTSQAPQAATIDANALASIIQAIARQIQPCADRQVIPAPEARQIAIKLNLQLNRDGTLAAVPRMVGSPRGVTDENSRYVQRVHDLGVAAFKGCSPLHLPPEYYSTPKGGWNNINFTWQLSH